LSLKIYSYSFCTLLNEISYTTIYLELRICIELILKKYIIHILQNLMFGCDYFIPHCSNLDYFEYNLND